MNFKSQNCKGWWNKSVLIQLDHTNDHIHIVSYSQEPNRKYDNKQRNHFFKGLIHLPKDPSLAVKSSEAADRWESEIGRKTEAASQIAIAKISTRNPPRFLVAIPETAAKSTASDTYNEAYIYACMQVRDLEDARVSDREEERTESVGKLVSVVSLCARRLLRGEWLREEWEAEDRERGRFSGFGW